MYGYVYLMRCKYEVFDKFKKFRPEVERQLRTYIKTIRSDQGGEYFFSEFRAYLSEHGNLSHLVTPGTSQQNGVAKRRKIILF